MDIQMKYNSLYICEKINLNLKYSFKYFFKDTFEKPITGIKPFHGQCPIIKTFKFIFLKIYGLKYPLYRK